MTKPITFAEMPKLTGRADLHMHTSASDGLCTAREMLDFAARYTDLTTIAITDHDVLDASLWAYSHKANYPFDIIPGVEVTTREGHVLALWVTQPIPKALSLAETCAAIHEQNGIAVLAHPFEPTIAPRASWRYLWHPEVLKQAGVDAVEVMNAGAFTPGGSRLARKRFDGHNLPVMGNSDAHSPSCIGTGITRFPGHTGADLRQALAQGWTLAEGRRWQITVYFNHYITSRRMKRSGSLVTNVR